MLGPGMAASGEAGASPNEPAEPLDLELESVTQLDTIRNEWNELAAHTQNVFATWQWNSIWWRHFGGKQRLRVTVCRSRQGRVIAVLPLYEWRTRPFRVVRFLGHHAGDELGPICRPADRVETARAIRATLAQHRDDILLGEHLPAHEGWSDLLDAKVLVREPSPAIRFESSEWERFLASRTSNFRGNVRRKQRFLSQGREIRYRLTERPEELGQDLDSLFALHRARWSGQPTTFSKAEAFHREFAACALEEGWLRLWLLEVDGRPRAACYGFRFMGVESFYQGGRDPAPQWHRSSLGFTILVNAMREAVEDGIVEYRLLRGGEDYKYQFTASDRSLETMAIARGIAPRAAMAATSLIRRSRILKASAAPFS
jgi:CelD/BcsL family acetyltransferase involved in cellulose biosynthesis